MNEDRKCQQFESLGFGVKIVEEFGERVKGILDGFTSPIDKVDIEAFRKALDDFITDADAQEEK